MRLEARWSGAFCRNKSAAATISSQVCEGWIAVIARSLCQIKLLINTNPLGGSVLTDYQHVGMVGNRLKGRRLRRNLASVASGAHEIHGLEDDRSLGGIVNLQGEKENYFESYFELALEQLFGGF